VKSFCFHEDAEIEEVAKAFGAEVVQRPQHLAQDESPEWLAWQHAIQSVQAKYGLFDLFLSLPTTAPLRIEEDVRKCLQHFDKNTDAVITMTAASRIPWFNMVGTDDSGNLRLLIEGNYKRRQDAPVAYDVTTLAYALRPSFILAHERIWEGRVKGVKIPKERSLDIDVPLDLEIARYLHRKRKAS